MLDATTTDAEIAPDVGDESASRAHRSRGFLGIKLKSTQPDPEDLKRYNDESSELMAEIKNITAKQQLEDIQFELARISNVLPSLRSCEHLDRIAHLKLAVAALGADKPNIEFARAIRQDTEFLIQRTQRGMFRFVYRIAGTTPLSAILAGVACAAATMLIAAILFALMKFTVGFGAGNLSIPGARTALFMAIFAAIGSFVSVVTRLADVAKTREYEPFLIFTTGFFKPWVGLIFAFFIFCLLESKVLQIGLPSTDPDSKTFLYLALAFVSGFSERLVSDFISRTETQIAGPRPAPVPPIQGSTK
jgi:hypothetical protein